MLQVLAIFQVVGVNQMLYFMVFNQSIIQSINQSISQSINQWPLVCVAGTSHLPGGGREPDVVLHGVWGVPAQRRCHCCAVQRDADVQPHGHDRGRPGWTSTV